jgi:UDP-2-acetamido-3-amino-2,3-dideoxy-glucuronate N-acetyltransferase
MTNRDPDAPFIHESAYVDDGSQIGNRTKVWHFCHIMPGTIIGEDSSLGQNVVVMNGVRIGNNVKIQNNVSVYEGVTLEDDVFCGPSMTFTNVSNPRSHVSRKDEYQPTLVRRGASIGANATIICGTTLGEYCFIGAGAVVSHDVPAYALMVGVPAQRVGWMCVCGERLPSDSKPTCPVCSTRYHVEGSVLLRYDNMTPKDLVERIQRVHDEHAFGSIVATALGIPGFVTAREIAAELKTGIAEVQRWCQGRTPSPETRQHLYLWLSARVDALGTATKAQA